MASTLSLNRGGLLGAYLEANGYTAATAIPMTFGVVTAYEAVKI
jgi:hypothetical protein